MRRINRHALKKALKQQFAAARAGGMVMKARQLALGKLFAHKHHEENAWSVATNDRPPSPDDRTEYHSEEWFRKNYFVPETVFQEGRGLVRPCGLPVESLKLDDSLLLWTEGGIEIGEVGDYLIYYPPNDLFWIVSPDSWVTDFCAE